MHFGLINNTYQPYLKANSKTVYITKYANLPPNILKELPERINKRVAHIPSNQDTFDAAKTTYNNYYATVVLRKKWYIKTTAVGNKSGMK